MSVCSVVSGLLIVAYERVKQANTVACVIVSVEDLYSVQLWQYALVVLVGKGRCIVRVRSNVPTDLAPVGYVSN